MLPHPKPDIVQPGQESVWSFPRPARAERTPARLRVEFAGRTIAETSVGFRVIETSHPPAYYFPPDSVDMSCLAEVRDESLCEWKGRARYFDLVVGTRRAAAAAWAYPAPEPAFGPIRDFVSFYPGRVDACFVDDEPVTPQEGRFYGGWITRRVAGPFKGPKGTEGW